MPDIKPDPTAEYWSLAKLARRCDVSPPRALRLVQAGTWKADAKAGRTLLFDSNRVTALRLLAKEAKGKSVAAQREAA